MGIDLPFYADEQESLLRLESSKFPEDVENQIGVAIISSTIDTIYENVGKLESFLEDADLLYRERLSLKFSILDFADELCQKIGYSSLCEPQQNLYK